MPPPGQDGGYAGELALLEQARGLLHRAWLNRAIALPPSTRDPFQDGECNPYRLVAGSYRSAAGFVLGAVLQVRSHLVWAHG